MARRLPFKVRVHKLVELWVDVEASTPAEAEAEAVKVPGVVSVFAKSAMRADRPADEPGPISVEDDKPQRK